MTINQGIGGNANDTLISVLGEDVAIITGLQATSLDNNNLILNLVG